MTTQTTCPICTHETLSTPLGNKNGYDIFGCTHCNSAAVIPCPTLEELGEYYDQYAKDRTYGKKKNKKIRRSKNRLKKFMHKAPGKTMLDVGCNYGYAVKAGLYLGLNAHGIDIDGYAIEIAKKEFGDEHFIFQSVEDYAASGKKADIIYTGEVIEHVPSPTSFVQSISEILNKDGLLYLTTPQAFHWRNPKTFTDWEEVKPPEHIHYFSRKGIQTILEAHGFKIIKFYFSLKSGIKLLAKKV